MLRKLNLYSNDADVNIQMKLNTPKSAILSRALRNVYCQNQDLARSFQIKKQTAIQDRIKITTNIQQLDKRNRMGICNGIIARLQSA